MEADLQSFVTFYLTGRKQAGRLDDMGPLKLRPAALAGYADLTRLRYDFPLVLIDTPSGERFAEPLSRLVDAALDQLASHADAERIRQHAFKLEQRIREKLVAGESGLLSEIWHKAAQELGKKDPLVSDSLTRLKELITQDGALLDCNGALPGQLIGHAWKLSQQRRAERFNEEVERLILKLSEIIEADYAISSASRSAENLRDAFGTGPLESFDFDAMSNLLKKVSVRENLPKRRRARIQKLITTLRSQRFYPTESALKTPYSFAFDTCSAAFKAYCERQSKAIELARAMAMARMEIKGEYNEERHDVLFDSFGENGLDAEARGIFPDYLVRINAAALTGTEQGVLTDILSADLPIKILVQTDDILETSPIENGHLAFTLRSKQLVRMTMGMGVYVVQSPAASLARMQQPIQRGLEHAGAAVFGVYSGDSPATAGLPPYLVSAAASESRLFPVFCSNPGAGRDWASRFTVEGNPQPEDDWPLHEIIWQDENCQTVKETVPFTIIDFVALDTRYAQHFARVPKDHWNQCIVPVSVTLQKVRQGAVTQVPYLLMTDADHVMHRVLVDEKLIREARRCCTAWNTLRELGGINNSHAQRLLEKEKAAWQSSAAPAPEAATPVAETLAAAQPVAAPEKEAEKSSGEAYIETPRCASCNECIQINDKMFAYDGNKQAFIANLKAGTYAQLVEAAENCQVAIIHPGKPQNPNEAGLDDLLKRAEAFM